ncbi:MAG TPA: EcsC family protein [Micromonosporaceae bacterium]
MTETRPAGPSEGNGGSTTPSDADPGGGAPPTPDAPEAPPARLWDRMRKDPQYAPEHLALEAVRRLGPEAREWAATTRAARPGVAPDDLAELAIRRFVTHSRLSGAVSGAAGLPGAVVDVGVLAWTQARMVLHIAAAYGHDPLHADRATDLLVLQKVHKVTETARLALGVAAGRERSAALLGRSNLPLAQVMLRLAGKLAQMAGIRAVKRMAAKAIPGAAIVLGTWANSSATRGLAGRAQEFYRHGGNSSAPHQRRS